MSIPNTNDEPRYLGEDTRITSSKELAGWYSYAWAAEVFVVCGVGSFIPITLEQLARERGVLLSDRTTPCSTGLDRTHIKHLHSAILTAAAPPPSGSAQCIVHILGVEVNTASFAMYTFSTSVLIQALLIISMPGAADHGRYRKSLLLLFAFIGAVSTMLFLPITPPLYAIGALLAIVANTCFGASFVLLNSFLPILVRRHSAVQVTNISQQSADSLGEDTLENDIPGHVHSHDQADSTSALLLSDEDRAIKKYGDLPLPTSPELQVSTQISSNGIGVGYVAAVLVQILSVLLVSVVGGSTFSLRLVLFMVGAWWLLFTIPAALWLRPRPGPPLHANDNSANTRTWLAYIIFAWKSLAKSALRARRLRDVLLFLAAWFLVSDAIATISGTAVLFAKVSLGMRPAALAFINVVVMIFGVVGALAWRHVSRLLGLKPLQTILACLCVFETIPLYALLGYIPAIQQLGVLGLQQPWEMYLLGAVYGFVLGGISSYCRALFGELIPPGSEAAFYALYAITDKGSSVFGPLIVGAITDATGEIRPAFWFLAVLIALPFPLMLFVNVDRGKAEGAALARELDATDRAREGGRHG